VLGKKIIRIQNDRVRRIDQRQCGVEAGELTHIGLVSDEVAVIEQIAAGGEKFVDDVSREIIAAVVDDDQLIRPVSLSGQAI
jgi:hypothetical protein